MTYHLGRDGTQLGQFTLAEIREGLQSGQFRDSDLVWTEGMPAWKAVQEVLPGMDVVTEIIRPPVSQPGSFVTRAGPHGHVGVGVMPTPGTAIASLILGIISLLTCYFGIFFAIPGVICGHLAMKSFKEPGNRYEGRGLAVAGLVMCYIWLGLATLLFLFFALFLVIGLIGA